MALFTKPSSDDVVRELTLLLPATSAAVPDDLPGQFSDVTIEQLRRFGR